MQPVSLGILDGIQTVLQWVFNEIFVPVLKDVFNIVFYMISDMLSDIFGELLLKAWVALLKLVNLFQYHIFIIHQEEACANKTRNCSNYC